MQNLFLLVTVFTSLHKIRVEVTVFMSLHKIRVEGGERWLEILCGRPFVIDFKRKRMVPLFSPGNDIVRESVINK